MTLKEATKYCKICFNQINNHSLYSLFHEDNLICEKCFSSLKATFINFKIGNIDSLAIYNYDDTIKKLIYAFKGCYDYELKDIFLNRYINYLKMKYVGFVIVPIPSSEIDDLKRGFNHVKEMFSALRLPYIDVLRKNTDEKQSSKNSKDRLNIENVLVSENIELLCGKKVLIVDDIYTTGATMFRAIQLVKKGKPKTIKVLVIAKTIDLKKRK